MMSLQNNVCSFYGIVYKTTNNINSKIYVGQDKHNRKEYKGSGTLIIRAFTKYGFSNFSKEILEYCTSKEHLNEREIFWIKELDARNKQIGYNITPGGEFGNTLSAHPDKDNIICKQLKGRQKYDSNAIMLGLPTIADKIANTLQSKNKELRNNNELTYGQISAISRKTSDDEK